MRRREFVALVAGVAAMAIGPRRFAGAQQTGRMRRIGVLMNLADDDPEAKRRVAALIQTLSKLGWSDGKNVQFDVRWGVDAPVMRQNAVELVALAPDVIVANAPPPVLALHEVNRSVPVVFAAVSDPVALGIIRSLAHPGGNATGFSSAEFGLTSKWVELLKEIAPEVKRIAVLQNEDNFGSAPQLAQVRTAARTLGWDVSSVNADNAGEVEAGVSALARSGNGGLIVLRTSENIAARRSIIALAAQYRLPAIYPLRFFVTDGGLVSYGPDIVDEYRQAAGYVDRILRGAKPADLPVQLATKYELVVNSKTAKTLGLSLPQTLFATADEVIE